MIGAALYDNGQLNEGRVYVHLGSETGLGVTPVSCAGDVNGDGWSDLIIGAPYVSGGHSSEGAAYIYLGSPAGLASAFVWTVEGNAIFRQLGQLVADGLDLRVRARRTRSILERR